MPSNKLRMYLSRGNFNHIDEHMKKEAIYEQKNIYLDLVNDASGENDINDTFFIWTNASLDIHIFVYKDLMPRNRTFIVCTKNETEDSINIYDLTHVKDINLRSEHTTSNILSFLFNHDFDVNIPFTHNDIVYYSPSTVINITNLGSDLFRSEYQNSSSHFQLRPIELINFNSVRLHADKYKMAEMIDELNNPQFSAELGECLFAYENEKFYVCASGIGGLIEHMMYLAIEKHGNEKDLRGNLTTDHYIGILKKEPFNIDIRAQRYIRNVMGFRNSVSHYNTGFTSKEICDRLFEGLNNIFLNYYLNEPSTITSN